MARSRVERSAALFSAVEGDDRTRVRALLRAGSCADQLDEQRFSPLLYAVRQRNFPIATMLLQHGARVDFGGGIYGSPLHVATVNIDPGMAALLLQFGADPNFADSDGHTPLHVLFSVFNRGGDKSIALSLFLLMRGANCNARGREGWAPLHLAAKRNQDQALQFAADCAKIRRTCLAGGVLPVRSLAAASHFDLNVPGGPQGWTPLHLAAREGFTSVLKVLIRAGANPLYLNNIGKTAREVCGGQFECHKLLQRAEREWLWFKVCSAKLRRTDKLFLTVSDSVPHPLSTRLAQTEFSSPSSICSSLSSAASRRSIRKSRTMRFARSVFGSDDDITDTKSEQDSESKESHFNVPQATARTAPALRWDRDALVRELTDFMEPDLPFDLEETQRAEFTKFASRVCIPETEVDRDKARFCWSSEVFGKQPAFVTPPPPPASQGKLPRYSIAGAEPLREFQSRAPKTVATPEGSSVHAPLTARTHKRTFEVSVDRLLPLPTVLRTAPDEDRQRRKVDSDASGISSRPVLRFTASVEGGTEGVHTPTGGEGALRWNGGEDSLRLNTIMSSVDVGSSDAGDEQWPVTDELLAYYQTLSAEAPETANSFHAQKYLSFLSNVLTRAETSSLDRERHLNDLLGLLTANRKGAELGGLRCLTLALAVGELRLNDSLDSVTLDDETAATAPALYALALQFARTNDGAALRQLFNRMTLDEVISLRGLRVEGATLVSQCLREERVREQTLLTLLAYMPYDSKSSAFELHAALKRRMLYVVRQLLLQGADPNAVDAKGRDALHVAVLYQCRMTLLALLYYPGLELNKVTGAPGREATPLELAILKGDVFAIGMLINRGALVRLGEVHNGRWRRTRDRLGASGSEHALRDLIRSLADPDKRTLIAAIFDANHFVTEAGADELPSRIVDHVRSHPPTAAAPKPTASGAVYEAAFIPGRVLGPPTIVRSTLKTDSGDTTRFHLKRQPLQPLDFASRAVAVLPPGSTTRCVIPLRSCVFCAPGARPSGAGVLNSSGSINSSGSLLGECVNCSLPVCSVCALHFERIAQAAIPFLQDLVRAPSFRGSSDMAEPVAQFCVRSTSAAGAASPRLRVSTGLSIIAITSERAATSDSPLERTLFSAPRAMLDVLALGGGSLEAVWCSDSLVVSNGVCGMISKRDLAFEDYCAIMSGIRGVYKRLQRCMSKETTLYRAAPRKAVALCTPRTSQVRDGKLAPATPVQDRASSYGTGGVAHAVAEGLWLSKNHMLKQLIRSAEVLVLCPLCATFFSSTPCLLRRV